MLSHPLEEVVENVTGDLLWSCNLAVRRDLFEQLGGFDEAVDRRERRIRPSLSRNWPWKQLSGIGFDNRPGEAVCDRCSRIASSYGAGPKTFGVTGRYFGLRPRLFQALDSLLQKAFTLRLKFIPCLLLVRRQYSLDDLVLLLGEQHPKLRLCDPEGQGVVVGYGLFRLNVISHLLLGVKISK